MKTLTSLTALTALAALVVANALAIPLEAAQRFTEHNPKYAQSSRATNHALGIAALEEQTIAAFKAMLRASSNNVEVTVIVTDEELGSTPGAEGLRAALTARELRADLQQMLRRAGIVVLEACAPEAPCVQVNARISARAITVNGFDGVESHLLPILEATAISSWNGRIIGEVQSAQFLGTGAPAIRMYERVGARNLVRAVGLLLLWDIAKNNPAEARPNTARRGPNRALPERPAGDATGAEVAAKQPEPPTAPAPAPTPTSADSLTARAVKDLPPEPKRSQTSAIVGGEPTPETPMLLAIQDREAAIKQVIESLKAGKE